MMAEGKIILFDRKEQTGTKFGTYLKIYSLDGTTHQIKDTRKELWNYFDNAERWQPFIFTYEEHKGVQYVSNVTDVKDAINRSAIIGMARRMIESTNNERIRSQAVSYSKDLICAGEMPLDNMFLMADLITLYVIGGDVNEVESYRIEATGNENTENEEIFTKVSPDTIPESEE